MKSVVYIGAIYSLAYLTDINWMIILSVSNVGDSDLINDILPDLIFE